ncbi:formyltransferase family protein [Jannaschia donghaensis]|nr:formyltransferase family protein [Jannaschia donghaensis]
MTRPDADLPGQARDLLPVAPGIAEHDDLWRMAHFDPNTKLADDLNAIGAPVDWLVETDINDPAVVDALSSAPGGVALYSGFGGQILRDNVLNVGKRILHVHGGYLPTFRGSTTNYYSLLAEGTLGASAIFMTAEIDAGPILMRRKFSAPPDKTCMDHLHDSAARAVVLLDTLSAWIETGEWPVVHPGPDEVARTYYVIHPALKHVAIYT